VDTLKANKEETAAAEEGQGRYREEVGKDREKAQRQKSKFSKEQILKVGREGREGRIEEDQAVTSRINFEYSFTLSFLSFSHTNAHFHSIHQMNTLYIHTHTYTGSVPRWLARRPSQDHARQ